MEDIDWADQPRYRYAALFGSALAFSWMVYSGLNQFPGAGPIFKAFLLLFGCHIGALWGFFFMVVFDRIIGRLR